MPVDRPVRTVLLVALVGLTFSYAIAQVVGQHRARAAGAAAGRALLEFLDAVNHSLDDSKLSRLESTSADELAEMCGLDPGGYAVRVEVLYHDGTSWVQLSEFGSELVPLGEGSTAQGYAAWTGDDRSPVVLVRLTVGRR
ncbi:MAG: hypothetical protein QI223_03450 [Candidatus Korarchaeota archaeon]|nr:hypothetical protein [Candidatus Korarchaeota archaeon]